MGQREPPKHRNMLPDPGQKTPQPRTERADAHANPISNHSMLRSVASIQRTTTPGGMPTQLQAGIEALSGVSMDGVRVHYNSVRPQQVGALAYAQGRDIYLGPGQESTLPHEAWHVVQQARGQVHPTTTVAGQPVNDNPALEHEADVMGSKALDAAPSSNT